MDPVFPQQQHPTMVTYQTVMVPVHDIPPTVASGPAGYYMIQPGPGNPAPGVPVSVTGPVLALAPQSPQGGKGAVGGDMFAHIRHIPMFRLSVASDRPNHIHSLPEAAYQVTKHIKVYKSVITRWACNLRPSYNTTTAAGPTSPPGTLIIDVYQLRNPFSMGRSPFRVHVSRDAQIRLGGRFDVAARKGRVWSKHFTKQHIDEVVVIGEGGVAVPAVIVERREEPVAPEESDEVKSRFEKWIIAA